MNHTRGKFKYVFILSTRYNFFLSCEEAIRIHIYLYVSIYTHKRAGTHS